VQTFERSFGQHPMIQVVCYDQYFDDSAILDGRVTVGSQLNFLLLLLL
jgi:hypothetical protein